MISVSVPGMSRVSPPTTHRILSHHFIWRNTKPLRHRVPVEIRDRAQQLAERAAAWDVTALARDHADRPARVDDANAAFFHAAFLLMFDRTFARGRNPAAAALYSVVGPYKTERQPSKAVAFRRGRRRLRIWSFRRPGGSAMQQASSDVAAAHLLTYASRYISECQAPADPSPAPDPPA